MSDKELTNEECIADIHKEVAARPWDFVDSPQGLPGCGVTHPSRFTIRAAWDALRLSWPGGPEELMAESEDRVETEG